MAASTAAPPSAAGGDSASSSSEIREGFLCPICMCDLGSFAQLSVHFDTAHSGEDRDALQQLKELFGNVKKKIKIKTDGVGGGGGGELSEAGSVSEADSSLKDDNIPVWEEQTLGHTRSHTSAFKTFRDERNSHAAIQRNKLVIRLKKLVDPSAPVEPQKRKEFEKSLVRWAPDEDVPLCPYCASTLGPPGGFGQTLKNLAKSNDVGDTAAVKLKELKDKFKLKQILGSRRHHCRTCGAVMCHECSFFLSFTMAERVVTVINDANEASETPTIESRKPMKAIRRSGSDSSLNSMAAFEGEMYVRICRDCWSSLESRFNYLETLHAPHPISPLYRTLMRSLGEIEHECPVYVEMARALHRGEQTYDFDEVQRKRHKLMKLYEGVDQVSKKIMANGKTPAIEGQATSKTGPSEKQLKLQRVIRQMAANFMQDYVFGLQSLPSAEEYERLKEKRQKELMREIEAQRQAELEAKRLAAKLEEADDPTLKRPTELSVGNQQAAKEGWLPTQVRADDAEDDPLLQQVAIIKGYITQAKQAGKMDEVKMLTENLKDLQLVVDKEKQERRRKELERRKEMERKREEEMRREEERDDSKKVEENGESYPSEEDYPDMLNPFAEED